MAVTATSSAAPLPQYTAFQAKQINQASETPSAATAATAATAVSLPTYATPIFKFDPLADISVEYLRDPSTGSVVSQIPPAQVVQKYRLGEMTATNNGLNPQNTTASASGNPATGTAAAGNVGGKTNSSGLGASTSITV
jgi:hypothetical protein